MTRALPAHDRLYANELAARRRICGLSEAARDEIVGRWWLLDGGIPEVPAFDCAIPVGPPLLSGDLAAVASWYGGRRHSLLARADRDGALIDEARRRGYRLEATDGAYALAGPATSAARPEGLEVVEVSEAALIEEYGRVGWAAEGLAPVGIAIARRARSLGFALLLGLHRGAPCATSLAAVHGSVVGVYNVAVAPELRRRGIGSAMTAAAVEAGRRRGATAGYLRARPEIAGLYERLGFRKAFDYALLLRPA